MCFLKLQCAFLQDVPLPEMNTREKLTCVCVVTDGQVSLAYFSDVESQAPLLALRYA